MKLRFFVTSRYHYKISDCEIYFIDFLRNNNLRDSDNLIIRLFVNAR